jgi:hypothetical protein
MKSCRHPGFAGIGPAKVSRGPPQGPLFRARSQKKHKSLGKKYAVREHPEDVEKADEQPPLITEALLMTEDHPLRLPRWFINSGRAKSTRF